MKILSIESSCDETAAAVVEDGRTVLSSVVSTQIEKHKIFGGVVPEIASRLHTENISQVVKKALSDADCTLEDVAAIAVTHEPGLIGALLVGVNYAKGLSLASGKPLVPVHHLRSHIAANYITHKDLKPPFMCLVVSGGNTLLCKVNDYTDFTVIGKTRDDAAGEAMDKAARTLGLPYPGGVNLDKISKDGDAEKYKFPKPQVENAPYDFSFSGLKTSVINLVHNAQQKGEELNPADVGASFIKAVVDTLAEKTVAAMENFGEKTLVLAGGVSANSVLRARMENEAKKHGWNLYLPDLSLCGDNGAMVGAQGYYEYISGRRADLSLNGRATADIAEN
ncbi:MAG: tRNA (adenosine(37)-N6)-threonylcarbamoyltransferase complex transferase subunit TsaD [Oscillospiraceae bacterium]|nr:tRNA (adenosine(37)-N6)-threonylcarbamoyltransferase complex transferase subunit TsaD [Oscillospiraceae bacterium]